MEEKMPSIEELFEVLAFFDPYKENQNHGVPKECIQTNRLSITIEKNPHLEHYQYLRDWMENDNGTGFMDAPELIKCMEKNEIWVLRFHPVNSGKKSSHWFGAPSLSELMRLCLETQRYEMKRLQEQLKIPREDLMDDMQIEKLLIDNMRKENVRREKESKIS